MKLSKTLPTHTLQQCNYRWLFLFLVLVGVGEVFFPKISTMDTNCLKKKSTFAKNFKVLKSSWVKILPHKWCPAHVLGAWQWPHTKCKHWCHQCGHCTTNPLNLLWQKDISRLSLTHVCSALLKAPATLQRKRGSMALKVRQGREWLGNLFWFHHYNFLFPLLFSGIKLRGIDCIRWFLKNYGSTQQ